MDTEQARSPDEYRDGGRNINPKIEQKLLRSKSIFCSILKTVCKYHGREPMDFYMFKTVKDFDVRKKRILVRCDFNVPLDGRGDILDDFKIKETIRTIEYLIEKKAKIILMSHLDDQNKNITPSLEVVKNRLEELLKIKLIKADDCIGVEAENKANNLNGGKVLLLENLRLHKEELDNDAEFAKNLSKLGDIYINDAFASSHRPHASIIGVPKYLPCGAGFLLQKEVENLTKILKNPDRPMLVLIGGKKVQDKAKFIDSMSRIADLVIISGLIKKELIDKKVGLERQEKIISPEGDLKALDISDQTAIRFRQKILKAKTIVWNGPFGKFEDKSYKRGTLLVAKSIIESGAFSVVGGGHTVEFLSRENLISKFNHVSTGGGAMLAYLSGDKLPGIEVLEQN